MGSSFAPFPPDFHQLALSVVEVSFGKKGQSGTPVRNMPNKHSPTSGTWTGISQVVAPFEGTTTETETGYHVWTLCLIHSSALQSTIILQALCQGLRHREEPVMSLPQRAPA